MKVLELNKAQARLMILHASGLACKGQFGTGREAVHRLVDHLGFVQLDTNYVVERAHHQVMAARVPDYQLEWLTDLTSEGQIFEYFASDAGFMPISDFRYTLPVKQSFAANGKLRSPAENRLAREVMDRIQREGPLMVGDFNNDRLEASSGWWDWRPTKVALERLYLEGKLGITRTPGFQKVYDLTANLISEEVDLTTPTPDEYTRFVIRRTLGALGIAAVKEMNWRARRVKGHCIKPELEKMVSAGEVRKVTVEGVKSGPLYCLNEQPLDIKLSGEVFILSPFDVLNVFRHRLRDFFDFDYQIECFVPAAKRQYGYFCLPILAGDRFVARMDAKAERNRRVLFVRNLHFELVALEGVTLEKIATAIQDFTRFNQCQHVKFERTNRPDYLKVIAAKC